MCGLVSRVEWILYLSIGKIKKEWVCQLKNDWFICVWMVGVIELYWQCRNSSPLWVSQKVTWAHLCVNGLIKITDSAVHCLYTVQLTLYCVRCTVYKFVERMCLNYWTDAWRFWPFIPQVFCVWITSNFSPPPLLVLYGGVGGWIDFRCMMRWVVVLYT